MEQSTARRLLRDRDAMGRDHAQPLDVAALARPHCSRPRHPPVQGHVRGDRAPAAFRRRTERAKLLLRGSDLSVTDICSDIGYTSLGTFTPGPTTISVGSGGGVPARTSAS
jgi:transcriptional regulator GlxA family with amidase domain